MTSKASHPEPLSEDDWVWIVEVWLDGKWVLRNGPVATYEQARWHLSDALRESNKWRIRGGAGLGGRGREGKG